MDVNAKRNEVMRVSLSSYTPDTMPYQGGGRSVKWTCKNSHRTHYPNTCGCDLCRKISYVNEKVTRIHLPSYMPYRNLHQLFTRTLKKIYKKKERGRTRAVECRCPIAKLDPVLFPFSSRRVCYLHLHLLLLHPLPPSPPLIPCP